MADVHDKETRSYNMSMIKGKDTKPEMVASSFIHEATGCKRDLKANTVFIFPSNFVSC
ncbi:MAG TPA: hypothetical protein PL009_14405 [Flavipsychrobacter sp.]|nr:hypothetical protein [Flavipsychrobacter sp.]